MEPAWTQFESTFKTKANIVFINVDEKTNPLAKQYAEYKKGSGGYIPYTVWLKNGKVVDQHVGGLELADLTKRSQKVK
jgi:hypothetical protein